MNPMATVLSAVIASAAAAPTELALATPALATGYAGVPAFAHGFAAPALAAGYATAPLVATAPAISVPAPYTTSAVQGEATVSIAQAPQQISKQVHYGQQTYVAGYNTEVIKPAIPDISIAVPTALKGTQQVNPAVVTVQKEPYIVKEPVHVEKPYAVPYDVPKYVEQVIEVPTPVHVAKPYAVPHPYPVKGQDIVQVHRTAPVIQHSHAGHFQAAPGYATAGYAATPALAHGYAAAHGLVHAAPVAAQLA